VDDDNDDDDDADVDECSEIDGVCRGGECKNTFGGFTCTCPAGYELDVNKQICAGASDIVLTLLFSETVQLREDTNMREHWRNQRNGWGSYPFCIASSDFFL